ncbi:SpoIIE family protein phosphatase [Curtobacterium ammoniigenes]|uniref:SpoIIE family protein phosphatase n=1 Tax=Curtobacterium ammoniigenes TaxID=395387 RepID=UPI0014704D42|nr:SpoIIE family protein phosphatase [Curtobacterium ammoniigenes]
MERTGSTSASDRSALLDALDIAHREPAERFERIVRTARELFGVPLSYLNFADAETLFTVTPSELDPGRSTPLSSSFCQFTIEQPDPLVIADTASDSRTAGLPGVTRLGIRFYAGVPLTMPGGVRIGSLCLMDTQPRTLDADERDVLTELARWAERVLAEGLQRDRLQTVVRAAMPDRIATADYTVGGVSVSPHGELGGTVLDWGTSAGAIHLSLLEVTGSARAAGLLAAGLRGALRARAASEPLAAILGLEAQVSDELRRAETFATAFHCRLDTTTGTGSFVDAGHGIAMLLPADGPRVPIRSTDLPIGLHPSGSGRQAVPVTLQRGDTLLVGSEGLLDLGDGTLATLEYLGSRVREAPSVEAFEELIVDRSASKGGAPCAVAVVYRH